MDVNQKSMVKLAPIGANQQQMFNEYSKGKNLFLYGSAGTGKTFTALYNALQTVLDPSTPQKTVYIVRSLIPSGDINFMSGSINDKIELFQGPYEGMVTYMFEQPNEVAFSMLYDRLKEQGTLQFLPTSFLKGVTLDEAVILVDECQLLDFNELDTIMTRIGQDSRIIFSGDFAQANTGELGKLLRIVSNMKSFASVEFGIRDIVRSGVVREYLIAKERS